MKLYFWDWYDSGFIQRCDMEFPFLSKRDAASQDVFTDFKSAKKRAIEDTQDQIADLRFHISELQDRLEDLENLTASSVPVVEHIRGM